MTYLGNFGIFLKVCLGRTLKKFFENLMKQGGKFEEGFDTKVILETEKKL